MIPKVVFCPKCRLPIKIPLKGAENIEVTVTLTIECGHITRFKGKDIKCAGKVVIKSKKEENNVNNVLVSEGDKIKSETPGSESNG